MPVSTAVFDTFHPLSCDVLWTIEVNYLLVTSFSNKIIDVSLIIYYQYYSTYCESLFLVWYFPASCKSGIISHLIKKQLDSKIEKKSIGLLQTCPLLNFF